MQLGISIGRLIGRKTIKRVERLFPWLCLLIGLIYILIFINHLTRFDMSNGCIVCGRSLPLGATKFCCQDVLRFLALLKS